ncbi:hypothetical protein QE152_g38334 [Popillia japonica]|uniref:Uncharacterized protein n=1 Tax=Popillia japonica TaxID=7064 RepID=A0AAW1I6T9_POPJA
MSSILWCFEVSCPVRQKKVLSTRAPNQKWINNDVKTSSNELRNLFWLKQNLKSPLLNSLYIERKKQHNKLIAEAKRNYYETKINLSSNKTKTLWRIVNDRLKPDNRCRPSINLTRNNTLITDAREISQEFGDYFSSVAGGMVAYYQFGTSTLHPVAVCPAPCSSFTFGPVWVAYYQFGTSTLHPVAVCPAPCSSFTFGPVCAENIIAVVNKIPNKTSYGDDGISSHLLKQIIGHIAEYLAFVVNMSFSTGKFPTPIIDVSLESLQALKTSGNIKVWRCDACKLKHNLIPPTTESSNTESPSIVAAGNGSVAWCNADIENIVSTKVKYAINIITEDIINLLRREIKLMSGNNNALSIELSELKKEVQNLKSENHELKDVVNNLKRVNKISSMDDKSLSLDAGRSDFFLENENSERGKVDDTEGNLFSLYYQNTQCITTSLNSLNIELSLLANCKFVFITEHWLYLEALGLLRLAGFELVASYCRKSAIHGGHGGSAIYTSTGLPAAPNVEINNLAEDSIFECCGVNVSFRGSRYLLICFYRPPSTNFTDFCVKFDLQSCLDNVIILDGNKSIFDVVDVATFATGFSDHKAITVQFKSVDSQLVKCRYKKSRVFSASAMQEFQLDSQLVKCRYKKSRVFSASAMQEFQSAIANESWVDVYCSRYDTNEKFSIFLNIFLRYFHAYFPVPPCLILLMQFYPA